MLLSKTIIVFAILNNNNLHLCPVNIHLNLFTNEYLNIIKLFNYFLNCFHYISKLNTFINFFSLSKIDLNKYSVEVKDDLFQSR